MILGRPVNSAVAVLGALFNLVVVFHLGNFNPDTIQIGAVNVVILVLMGFVANQDPTVKAGSSINVVTPDGEANRTIRA